MVSDQLQVYRICVSDLGSSSKQIWLNLMKVLFSHLSGREALNIAEDMESETDSDDTAESGEIPFYYRSPPPVSSDIKPGGCWKRKSSANTIGSLGNAN